MSMNISLPKQMEENVRARVKSGRYASVSEVVRHALRLLMHEDRCRVMQRWGNSVGEMIKSKEIPGDDK